MYLYLRAALHSGAYRLRGPKDVGPDLRIDEIREKISQKIDLVVLLILREGDLRSQEPPQSAMSDVSDLLSVRAHRLGGDRENAVSIKEDMNPESGFPKFDQHKSKVSVRASIPSAEGP